MVRRVSFLGVTFGRKGTDLMLEGSYLREMMNFSQTSYVYPHNILQTAYAYFRVASVMQSLWDE